MITEGSYCVFLSLWTLFSSWSALSHSPSPRGKTCTSPASSIFPVFAVFCLTQGKLGCSFLGGTWVSSTCLHYSTSNRKLPIVTLLFFPPTPWASWVQGWYDLWHKWKLALQNQCDQMVFIFSRKILNLSNQLIFEEWDVGVGIICSYEST